jgi:hypothetical protein
MGAFHSSPREPLSVRVQTSHVDIACLQFDAGAPDPLASLRAVIAEEVLRGRTDFELRRVAPKGVRPVHEALDLWWKAGVPVRTPGEAAALQEYDLLLAWTPAQIASAYAAGAV